MLFGGAADFSGMTGRQGVMHHFRAPQSVYHLSMKPAPKRLPLPPSAWAAGAHPRRLPSLSLRPIARFCF